MVLLMLVLLWCLKKDIIQTLETIEEEKKPASDAAKTIEEGRYALII